MIRKIIFISLLLVFAGFNWASAEEKKGEKKIAPKPKIVQKIASDCDDPTSQATLDINNVRSTILGANDMWWDLQSNAAYEIPKIKEDGEIRRHSLFAGSVWVGGKDVGGILKVAVQTYRSSNLGVGFWSGPLTQGDATTEKFRCANYNRHWKVNRELLQEMVANTELENPNDPNSTKVKDEFFDTAPAREIKDILEWPAEPEIGWNHGVEPGEDFVFLAPFVDVDGDEEYNPTKGDYPKIRGDQSIWFITNDKGNTSGSGSEAIGMEIQTEAFAFVSNDELNNMTFYGNKIVNRSSITLDSCFMSQWVDPDLGFAGDDYIACDVPRGLGICFNGDDTDEGTRGYGENPPSVGIDFFEGPFSDENDGIDNDRDCEVDEIDIFGCDKVPKTERMIMSKFMYFTNGTTFPLTDPSNAAEAFNFMIGRWADGVPLTYGGNGRGGTQNSEMAFPGLSDQEYGWSLLGNCQNPTPNLPEWSESTVGNQPGDRRFVQSGGPFTLEPGAVNFITIGVVWARASSGGPQGSLNLLLQADTKAQALFENCFEILNGPDAPDLKITELDQELIINMVYRKNSNNYQLKYQEVDPLIKALNQADSNLMYDEFYRFQGILVYQLASSEVSTGELQDLDRARLIYQCDLADNIERIVNYEVDPDLDINIPSIHPVVANNQGIEMSLRLNTDAFTTLDFVNHRQYHFMAIAYGYNNYEAYNLSTKQGQAKPYLEGRRNVRVTTAIPHKYEPEFNGLVLNAQYGDAPEITKQEGLGNGGNVLAFTNPSATAMLESPYFVQEPTYAKNFGPVNVKVVDPKILVNSDFEMYFYTDAINSGLDINANSRWYITYNGGVDTVHSDSTISFGAEQILTDDNDQSLGLSVLVQDVPNPQDAPDDNDVIGSSLEYTQESQAWLDFVADGDIQGTERNWILAGPANDGNPIPGDEESHYETLLGGTWAPYRFANWGTHNPAIAGLSGQRPLPSLTNELEGLHSIELIITSDKSKWTRSCVLEMSEDRLSSVNQQYKNRLRCQPSVDKDGKENARDNKDVGLGWFPGYALDLETGERLNICFGESSSDSSNNGRDLMWNPTDSGRISPDQFGGIIQRWGGFHNIYVMKSRYDEGAKYQRMLTKNFASATSSKISNNLDVDLWNFYKDAMWVGMPKLLRGAELLATDVKIGLYVNRSYEKALGDISHPSAENYDNPTYRFSTKDLAPVKADKSTAQRALDLVNIVPNPYYAYSDKESNPLDTRVKITNLPPKCTITIYSLNGSLIRSILKDDPSTSVDWNLRNQVDIPIAGGTYIVHIDAGACGERTLKWFGVLRPVDLDTF